MKKEKRRHKHVPGALRPRSPRCPLCYSTAIFGAALTLTSIQLAVLLTDVFYEEVLADRASRHALHQLCRAVPLAMPVHVRCGASRAARPGRLRRSCPPGRAPAASPRPRAAPRTGCPACRTGSSRTRRRTSGRPAGIPWHRSAPPARGTSRSARSRTPVSPSSSACRRRSRASISNRSAMCRL